MMEKALVTGGTGYIGSWVCKYLLEAGHTVRVTVRNKNKTEKLGHLLEIAEKTPGKLEIWEADLLTMGAFDAAAQGCDVVYHIASPFIINIKDAQKELIDPALLGTRNVLSAAQKSGSVKKIVLTSSVAAIYGDAVELLTQKIPVFTEAQWNETSSLTHQPYSYSKVLAEKAAWEIAKNQQDWKLVVINPSFVMGPSLTPNSDSESIRLMKDFLSGKFALGVPDLKFGVVDVRDVAKAHILAAQNPAAEGRHILSNKTLSMLEIGAILKHVTGKGWLMPWFTAPRWVISAIGFLFGITPEFVKKNIGFPLEFDHSKSVSKLGVQYRSPGETFREMVEQMKAQGLV
jgi:nucleoside-diphosphate-sugar epimerase